MKLDYNKHYMNKSHTKHWYMNHIFDNFEWNEFIHGIRVQNISISINDKLRVKPKTCERWHSINNIAVKCKNLVFYRTNFGTYICKQCAREISKIRNDAEFYKIN